MKNITSILAFAFCLVATHSALAASFPSFAEMETMTPEKLKKVPDVSVASGKALKDADLKGKSEVELTLMRNWIFAQHGFKFTTPYLKNYFASRPWYKQGAKWNHAALTETDKANVKAITDFQAKYGQVVPGTAPNRGVAATMPKDDQGLKTAVLNMGYCHRFGSEATETFKFNPDGSLVYEEIATFGGESAYGSAYGSAYEESAYGSAYGSAYEGEMASEPIRKSGTWKIKGGKIIVKTDGKSFPVALNKKSFHSHVCFFQ